MIKRDLQTISITLQSNNKLLLTDTEQFKVQLDISSQDLNECNQKLDFMIRGVNGDLSPKLMQLKEISNDLSHRLDIFNHIYTLKTKGK